MKTQFSKLVRPLSILCLAASSVIAGTPGRVVISSEGTHLSLSWDCVSGRHYQLYSTTNLDSPWREVATQPKPLVANGNKLSYTLNLAQVTQFYRVAELAEFAPTGMVWISPGTFTMGSQTNEVDRFDWEGPQTAVTISRGFWMGTHEVTQEKFLAVAGNNPSYFSTNNGYAEDLRRPVEQVSWIDATNFCSRLTQQERAAGRIATNSVYRLPTEAEWEYACRGWTSTRFSYGDDSGYTNLQNYGWFLDNSGGITHPVGQKLPNPWGLYDMHGNVLEWCQDWWGDYSGGTAVDPQGPATGSTRVSRGGDWYAYSRNCRSASRFNLDPEKVYSYFGFRIVLVPGQ